MAAPVARAPGPVSALTLRTPTRRVGPGALRASSRVVARAADSETVSSTLSGADAEAWQAAAATLVAELGLEDEATDPLLERAFGWKSQAYWRQEKVKEIPVAAEITERLEYLRGWGIEGTDLQNVVSKFPEVIACDVEGRLAENFKYLEKEYFMKGKIAAKAMIRKPEALGNVLDCTHLNGCVGECNRCWVRF